MKIGILCTSIGNFGKKGYYNAQEIGLAKALSRQAEQVAVYKLVPKSFAESHEKIEGYSNIDVFGIPSLHLGIHGIIDVKRLETSLDCLIYLSDTQLCVPVVFRWAKKNRILFLPYIGVLESHAENKIKAFLMNIAGKRNVHLYQRCMCMAKTDYIEQQMRKKGIKNILSVPVGLDTDLLKKDYKEYAVSGIKEELGFQPEERIILFVGRLTEEKQPMRMLDIFYNIVKKKDDYHLVMIGSGEQKENVCKTAKQKGIYERITLIDKLPNCEMWKMYRIADCFINLNQQEIFGMAILEAMYYETKVIAWKAPGPEMILVNGETGYLVESNEEVIEKVFVKEADMGQRAHEEICKKFVWEKSVEMIKNYLCGKI